MASVRKLNPNEPKSPWVCEYTDASGARRRKTPKTGLKKDAEAIARKIEREMEDRTHTPSRQSIKVSDGLELWLQDCARRHKSGSMTGSTVAGYTSIANKHLKAYFGNRRVADLTTAMVQDRFDELASVFARKTLAGVRAGLSAFLAFMVRRGFVVRNVLRDDPLRVSGKKLVDRPRFPTKEEVAKLLEATEVRTEKQSFLRHYTKAAIVHLGILGGLRRGEMAGLQWSDVDFSANSVNIRHGYTEQDKLKTTKTESGIRSLPMPEAVMQVLRRLLAYQQLHDQMKLECERDQVWQHTIWLRYTKKGLLEVPPEPDMTVPRSGHVIRGKNGKPMWLSDISTSFVDAIRKAGLPVAPFKRLTLHTLRHGYTTLLIDDGIPAKNLQRMLGHASVRTTYDVYGHLFPNDEIERQSVDRIGAGLARQKRDSKTQAADMAS